MILNIFNNIWDKLNEWGNGIKDFFLENSRQPFLWLIIIVIGLIVFEFVYKNLHKD